MRSDLDRIYQLLQNIEVSGYTNVKSLALVMDGVRSILGQMEQGEIVVRRKEEGKRGTEDRRETN